MRVRKKRKKEPEEKTLEQVLYDLIIEWSELKDRHDELAEKLTDIERSKTDLRDTISKRILGLRLEGIEELEKELETIKEEWAMVRAQKKKLMLEMDRIEQEIKGLDFELVRTAVRGDIVAFIKTMLGQKIKLKGGSLLYKSYGVKTLSNNEKMRSISEKTLNMHKRFSVEELFEYRISPDPDKMKLYGDNYIDYKIPKWVDRLSKLRALEAEADSLFQDYEDLGNNYMLYYLQNQIAKLKNVLESRIRKENAKLLNLLKDKMNEDAFQSILDDCEKLGSVHAKHDFIREKLSLIELIAE